ncbi:Protein of unknown function DUF241 [Macleaya cordata]|uniref:DUF241 domain-containing protein n=1 Tax=Macleaya cordata TaxID=56857 RepID=A0A200QNY1_MACCD|nr:Protein of unknown function DUF241 [Macleaya cordata]
MASSNKIAYHTRSISLPTRSSPLSFTLEEQLCRLRSSQLATSSSSSISHNLAGLKDLYESVEDFLSTQNGKCLDTVVLDGSIMLLDVCGTTRDILSQMKQSVQDLQSSIRRRRGADLDLANELNEYMTSRKKVTKVIRKCLGGLKKIQNKNSDNVSILKEVEATTLAVFESLLSFLSGPRSKQSSWSLVSKLMPNKRVACSGETNVVEKADIALNILIGHKQNKTVVGDVKNAQNLFEALEMSIQDLEEGVECVFRGLVKTRVSLLNILNQ